MAVGETIWIISHDPVLVELDQIQPRDATHTGKIPRR